MNVIQRLVNSIRSTKSPAAGAMIKPMPEDSWRLRPADGLTPGRLAAILRAADAGDLEEQMALYEQMEEKDPHLFSIAQTRRLAVTGLAWRIAPASAVDPERYTDRAAAEATARYCAEALAALDDFDATLTHLALGVGRNIAVAELVWEATAEGVRLRAIAPVDFGRLRTGRGGELRIVTEASTVEGITPPADKFIVHRPHGPGHAGRGGLLRVTALAFLGKRYALRDWLVYMEVFGMPVRIARYQPGATVEEKRELLRMLQQLGTDAAGVFSKAVDLEIKQTRVPGDVAPYETMCHFFNREMSKAWLGQTLTTDTARSLSTVQAAQVQEHVRLDIRNSDLKAEAHTIRRDLLAPLVRLRFGPDAPVPFFVRQADRPRDPAALAEVLATAVNALALRVPMAWAHAALGIPQAEAQEAVVAGVRDKIG